MTQNEWSAATDPVPMLRAISGGANARKLRLFGVACCRHVHEAIPIGHYRKLLQVAESFADGAVSWGIVKLVLKHAAKNPPQGAEAAGAVVAVTAVAGPTPSRVATDTLSACTDVIVRRAVSNASQEQRRGDDPASVAAIGAWEAVWERDRTRRFPGYYNVVRNEAFEAAQQAAASYARQAFTRSLRCVFGNSFYQVAFDPTWITSTTIALAQHMYDSRDFSAMPILADALQDAECDNTDVLDHCRTGGPHGRGCWVVDLLLGKE